MRRTLLTSIALTLALAACSKTIDCAPCGGAGVIDVRSIRSGATGIRVCIDGQCGRLRPMPADPYGIWLSSEVYDASKIELELYNGKKYLKSYSGPLDIPAPDLDDCVCDEFELAPSDNNTLIRVN
ncbi:hypothetical protein [Kribbella sp. CA-293567]|uniref:hypothetical protein n=1 Tax=Kribbella sp. CA-293567 TaxID=3002436 RepID=UPI0022DE87EB|nr:hypothetical protein [Kribbella sp. CA-293567]WBQ07034.1 hypothetical protein OX958_09585 [Kribbella sp. CA-293567]